MEGEKSFARRHWFLLSFFLIVLILAALIYYFFFHTTGYRGSSNVTNPAANLSIEEAVAQFNSGFIYYLLYSIKAYNLHNPLFSSDTPKIEIHVGADIYNAIIENGNIKVQNGEIANKDIIIVTTKEDAVKMMKDTTYVQDSFRNGNSQIELVAGKTTLFMKGYLNLYSELTGKSMTGSVIEKIFG